MSIWRHILFLFTKRSASQGEFYELNAFHWNGNVQTQLRLPQNFLSTWIETNEWLLVSCSYATIEVPLLIWSRKWRSSSRRPSSVSFVRMRGQPPNSSSVHKPAWLTLSLLNWKAGVFWTIWVLIRVIRSSAPLAPTVPMCLPIFHPKLPRYLKIDPAQ